MLNKLAILGVTALTWNVQADTQRNQPYFKFDANELPNCHLPVPMPSSSERPLNSQVSQYAEAAMQNYTRFWQIDATASRFFAKFRASPNLRLSGVEQQRAIKILQEYRRAVNAKVKTKSELANLSNGIEGKRLRSDEANYLQRYLYSLNTDCRAEMSVYTSFLESYINARR